MTFQRWTTCAVEFGVRAGVLADVPAKHDPVTVLDLDGHPVAGRHRRASAPAHGAVLLEEVGGSERRFDHDMVEQVCEVVGGVLDDRAANRSMTEQAARHSVLIASWAGSVSRLSDRTALGYLT